jgi:acetyl esterase/lipase
MQPTLGATCYGLARHTGLRVLALPCRPAPFPAGLLDALAGYRMLVDRGFEPQNILLVSESAGAFVCLALLRYLKELRDEHDIDAGMPGGTVMSSVRSISVS